MVLQVGDKVVVWGAGTDFAFARKVEPLQVGDRVEVITLSDGTKLAMPKIELDLSDYVFVLPEWDPGFDIGGLPFGYGVLPLGAAVFTIADIVDCRSVLDENREWDGGDLTGTQLIILSGNNKSIKYTIQGYYDYKYYLTLSPDIPSPSWEGWTYIPEPGTYGSWSSLAIGEPCIGKIGAGGFNNAELTYYSPVQNVVGAGGFIIKYRFRYREARGYTNSIRLVLKSPQNIIGSFLSAGKKIDPDFPDPIQSSYWYVNPSWPDTDTLEIPVPMVFQTNIMIYMYVLVSPSTATLEFSSPMFYESDCITDGLQPGDKYIIYNPATKRLVFNDSTKLLTSADWRETSGTGEEISSPTIEYAWDGQGYVYLSSSKTTMSTIQFDDMLKVEATAAEKTKTIDFHLGERISQSGETVSRELTNITSILRAGNNQIKITAKHTEGGKVGFVTAVYVKRSMSPVSL